MIEVWYLISARIMKTGLFT